MLGDLGVTTVNDNNLLLKQTVRKAFFVDINKDVFLTESIQYVNLFKCFVYC